MKRCQKCGVEQPSDQFYRRSSNSRKRENICKRCRFLAAKPLAQARKDEMRTLRHAYRRLPEVRQKLTEAQRIRRLRKRMAAQRQGGE
jgi:hypothetical protein